MVLKFRGQVSSGVTSPYYVLSQNKLSYEQAVVAAARKAINGSFQNCECSSHRCRCPVSKGVCSEMQLSVEMEKMGLLWLV
ncbi:hypothetical protein MKW98_000309 [Papaver atlanticum]|uniref:Uncharacterized protein n=1 Tax=Papaver atlanticum TaxID=357466 RepID=A0AAD4S0W5_9MAGN|nr:hypothetical protein MKW98_000309 [Papaver atlanticum]